MCGIAGIVQLNGDLNSLKRIQNMMALVAHRGPDGQGSIIVEKVALGHRRLAILDLSKNGSQPMQSFDGNLHITFNGAIYNFVELRQELLGHGYEFFGNSDTEVLLNAYGHWGKKCVDHLNGMWSFAILDMNKNIIFCSRDRFGEKPFYYHQSSLSFSFGSEIRQLLPELDEVFANKSLLERFFAGVAGEDYSETFFKGVHKLPAGHNLIFDLTTNQMEIACYYELKKQCADGSPSLDELEKGFKLLFFDSVKLRLRSDVAVGTCLSGGLDSSSISSVAAEQVAKKTSRPFKAITAASTDLTRDETDFAKAVVKTCELDWHVIKPDYERFKSVTREVVRAQEEPFGSASIVMQYEVMRAAANNGIKVLLDGQGADEVLLGYERYFAAYLKQVLNQKGARHLYQEAKNISRNNASMSIWALAKYYLYFNYSTIRKLEKQFKFYFLSLTSSSVKDIRSYATSSKNMFDLQKFEITQSNLLPLLRFEDKNAMWHSIETRLPFLDYRLVEYCCNIPIEAKINGGWTKYILRSAMRDRLPEKVVWRTNKFGFEAPQSDWIAKHKVQMLLAINGSSIVNYFFRDKVQIEKILKNQTLIWKLYIVALWEEEFGVIGVQ